MRETIGEVKCRYCEDRTAEVRKNIKGKLYLYCSECGIHHLNTPAGQNWILNNVKMYGAEGKPEPAPRATPPAADPGPEPTPEPATIEGGDYDEDR